MFGGWPYQGWWLCCPLRLLIGWSCVGLGDGPNMTLVRMFLLVGPALVLYVAWSLWARLVVFFYAGVSVVL